ncbi:hypothetical protein [Streptomyces humi]
MGSLRRRLLALPRLLATQSGGSRDLMVSFKGESRPGEERWVYLCLAEFCEAELTRQRHRDPAPPGCPAHGPRHPVRMPASGGPSPEHVSAGLYIYVCRDNACLHRPVRERSAAPHGEVCDGPRHTGNPPEAVLSVLPGI